MNRRILVVFCAMLTLTSGCGTVAGMGLGLPESPGVCTLARDRAYVLLWNLIGVDVRPADAAIMCPAGVRTEAATVPALSNGRVSGDTPPASASMKQIAQPLPGASNAR
jgi:hypothetical protein